MTAPQPIKTVILDLLRDSQRASTVFVQTLDEAERAAIGTPQCWSAKDHLAHMTYCLQQNLILKVNGIREQQEVPPREANVEQMNDRVFEEHKLRPWEDVHATFEHVYADLIGLVERLSEAELQDSHRFSIITREAPLYTAFLANGYEHLQEHFMQYYLDRSALPPAMQIREQCTNQVLQAEAPAWVKGWFLYKLASFYAQQHQREQAAARLQEALAFDADLKEWLENDPELAAIHNQSV